MPYRVKGLSPEPFRDLFGLNEEELARRGAKRLEVDRKSSFPCRISLEDAEPGEAVLLVNYEHQPADTPYRSRHAVFVREGEYPTYDAVAALPEQLRTRLLSIRAFDADGMMIDADVADGRDADAVIERLLADTRATYLHVHYARQGCYAARIERA